MDGLKDIESEMEEEAEKAQAEANVIDTEELVGGQNGAEIEMDDVDKDQDDEEVVIEEYTAPLKGGDDEHARSSPSAKALGKKRQRDEDVIEVSHDSHYLSLLG